MSDSRSKAQDPRERRISSAQVAVALIGLAVCGCASHDPTDMSVLIPEGSIYAEPAEHVRALGYTIVYVDTNIGTFEALRWRGRRETTRSGTVWGTADYLVVDVYRDAPADRVVVTVVAQTVTASHTVRDFPPYAIQAAGPPSTTVRRDAEALLRSLGCTQVQSEQRLTGVYGPRIDVKCEDSPEG